jgi:SAM-dependent methyltransferase
MSEVSDTFRARARATWASGNWDGFAELLRPVGALVLDRIGLVPGLTLLDVGTGSGGNVAIPAAQRGAEVVGADVTPELFDHARRRAAQARVHVTWVEADAQDLPFADASFDRVISTFGAMFAPDHERAAAELVRVCRSGGQIAMTTWVNDGFVGELFKLTGSATPPPPPGVGTPPQWGIETHIEEAFAAAGATPVIAHESVQFVFPSVEDAVKRYADEFGPFVMARKALEPQGRWDAFLDEFGDLVNRFNPEQDGSARIQSDYFLITVSR